MLATDDVVRLRVAASRWNKGDRYGPLGRIFFNMLKLEQHRELWHYDKDGNRLISSVRRRIPVVGGIRGATGSKIPGRARRRDGFGFLWERHVSPVKGRYCCHTAAAHELFRRSALASRELHLGFP